MARRRKENLVEVLMQLPWQAGIIVGLLGCEPLEVEHHFDRAAVSRIEVHRRVSRILDAGNQAAEAADVGHAAKIPLGDGDGR